MTAHRIHRESQEKVVVVLVPKYLWHKRLKGSRDWEHTCSLRLTKYQYQSLLQFWQTIQNLKMFRWIPDFNFRLCQSHVLDFNIAASLRTFLLIQPPSGHNIELLNPAHSLSLDHVQIAGYFWRRQATKNKPWNDRIALASSSPGHNRQGQHANPARHSSQLFLNPVYTSRSPKSLVLFKSSVPANVEISTPRAAGLFRVSF